MVTPERKRSSTKEPRQHQHQQQSSLRQKRTHWTVLVCCTGLPLATILLGLCRWIFVSLPTSSSSSSSSASYIRIDSHPIRIASPSAHDDVAVDDQQEDNVKSSSPPSSPQKRLELSSSVVHSFYTQKQRNDFVQKHGNQCWPGLAQRYSVLLSSPTMQLELWKYCMMQLGVANVYWNTQEVRFLVDAIPYLEQEESTIIIPTTTTSSGATNNNNSKQYELLVHPSFLKVPNTDSAVATAVATEMCRMLVETELQELSLETMSKALYAMLDDNKSINKMEWKITCNTAYDTCPLAHSYCCNAHDGGKGDADESIVALVQHPFYTQATTTTTTTTTTTATATTTTSPSAMFHSTIQVQHTHKQRPTLAETPNFFDILLHNNCLPTQKVCSKCLKKLNDCALCLEACGCYCKALCKIRPPAKTITQIWTVRPPPYAKESDRLIPKIIHQTWFEPVTQERYPNMSRLIESWKQQIGWDYRFYDDASAGAFLSKHFPPEVRQAYDSILPGAFKADLFRYCVLLIDGGVYADMDVLLTTSLDTLLEGDVGFMVPMDSPGSTVGAQSCLWNGLLAVAPGHPLLAKTVEMVVNNIRNRFTSVDYDDMLCPNPATSVTHTVDTLFTCGPCILGAAMNTVLRRHPQAEWTVGDVDLWIEGNDDSDDDSDDLRRYIQGRTIILQQNKEDMGAHRFTWVERNVMVASTDMPDYDDRPADKVHYSKTHEKVGVYGLRNLYTDPQDKANELIQIKVRTTTTMASTMTTRR